MASADPLPAQLSQALVAFVVEWDNEFEHRMPHRTTRHGSTPGLAQPPWLVSMAMWEHCMRLVPPDGITAQELADRSQLTPSSLQTVVKRMSQWWGYLRLQPAPSGGRAAVRIRPTEAGLMAQEIWASLTGEIERRWAERLGEPTLQQLRLALQSAAERLDPHLPDFLPLGEARLDRPLEPIPPTLPALLSRPLVALALDYGRGRELPLAVSANLLRVVHSYEAEGDPVRVSRLAAATGVAKMTTDVWLGRLEAAAVVAVGPHPGGGRGRAVTLTPKGRTAAAEYLRWQGGVERRWADQLGPSVVEALAAGLRSVVGDGTRGGPLWRGLEPYPDGWRAQVARPDTLPHHPAVTLHGGFPDGS
ncbi:MAG TPA: hypothetical protein VKV06_09245 [Acidimicrobiales bacterium]|nr:hypothetical protein [Acidimicrobiales bacterium]